MNELLRASTVSSKAGTVVHPYFYLMKKTHPFFILLFIYTISVKGQEQENQALPVKTKGTFYAGWGYHRDWFSKSDLHFINTTNEPNAITRTNDYYDFTIYGAKAKDRPGFKHIVNKDLSIPQYAYRIGYFFNKKQGWGIEINFDHVKYVMDDYQTLHVKGTMHNTYIDQDTLVDPNTFLHFEHTNGANFLMLNVVKRQQLLASKDGKHQLHAIARVGFGTVIPKTDVYLFGQEVDNRFHIAGYVTGMEAGFRYEALKNIYLEYTAKGTFANYTNVLVIGSGKANHHFWAFENILVLGFQFPL
jgi:hypothetical protein